MSTPLQHHPTTVQVDSGAIHSYATGQASRTTGEAARAATTVRRLGNGDVNAFGVCLAQVLGVPSQVALGVAARHLERLSADVEEFAADLQRVADRYERAEHDNLVIAHGLPGGR